MIDVLQVCDSLSAGGLERMLVTIANHLPRDRFRSHVCMTRNEGPLAAGLAADVRRISLGRTGKLDLRAALRLVRYAQQNNIKLVHAHGTSLFFVALASLVGRFPRVIWHDHYGRYAVEERPPLIFGPASQRASGIIAVNEPLAEWARTRLHTPADRVWYLPNFVVEPEPTPAPPLPGQAGSRIVCVANFRPEKDHDNLLRAFKKVLTQVPAAHLILLGAVGDAAYHARIIREMSTGVFAGHVSWLGSRPDVPAILKTCEVAVLASASEGLPIALLEYGMAGMATVTTNIGQCGQVVDDGRVAVLVPSGDSEQLGAAMLSLLQSPEDRAALGRAFRRRILDVYSVGAVMGSLVSVYDAVLGAPVRT